MTPFHFAESITHAADCLASLGIYDWMIVLSYLVVMLVIGVRAAYKESKQKSGTREFFTGGRRIPTWVLAISIVGSMLSAATFVGAPSEAFRGNLTYLILNVGGFMAVIVVGIFFVPRLYAAGTVTIYGFLSQRFGEPSRVAVSIAFLVGRLLASGSRLMLVGIPLCMMIFAAEGDKTPPIHQLIIAILIVGAVGTFYTAFGGITTVVWVDLIQFTLVVGAAMVTIGLLLNRIPLSVPEIIHTLGSTPLADGTNKLTVLDTRFDISLPFTIWAAITGSFMLGMATYGVDHDFAQRFMIAKSKTKAAFTVIAAQFISIAVVSLFMIIGLLLSIYYQRPDIMGAAGPGISQIADGVPPYQFFMINHMPQIIAGLAVAGLFAVSQGSMDSAINAMASSAIADLYLPWRKSIGRPIPTDKPINEPKIAVAAIGALMTLVGIFFAIIYDPKEQTFLQFALGVLNFALSGMLAVFLVGLFTRRGNNASVIAALITGFFVTLTLQPFIFKPLTRAIFNNELSIPFTYGMFIATALAFIVCVMGKPSSNDVNREIHPARA